MKKLNTNLINVVKLLSNGGYQDGEAIGRALQMTRSAVWKAIRKLRQHGVCIDAVKGKGYVLREPFVLLDALAMQTAFYQQTPMTNERHISFTVFETITSTNDYLMSIRHKTALMVCLAEQQTAGRGRFGRKWHSPFGKHLYFSCLYRFDKDVSELAGLSLVVGLAVASMLNDYVGAAGLFRVKWPNDVYVGMNKIAGSLVEVRAEAHSVCNAVIGIGINANRHEVDSDVAKAWASLANITERYVDRNDLCVRLLHRLLDYLDRFAAQGLSSFLVEWTEADILVGKDVTLHRFDESVTGIVVGVNENGHLLLRDKNDVIQAYSSGEATFHRLLNIRNH